MCFVLSAVEVIGVTSVCQTWPLPGPRHSLFAGRLSDRAIVCGGNDGDSERAECFVLHANAGGRWVGMTPDLGEPLIFAAAAGDAGDNFYVVGGRKYSFDSSREWEFLNIARVYNSQDNIWRTLLPLPTPTGIRNHRQGSIYSRGNLCYRKITYLCKKDYESSKLLKK